MTYDVRETSRFGGTPIFLYLFGNNEFAPPYEGFDPGTFGPYAYTNAEAAFTREGVIYQPWPIKHGQVVQSGGPDRKTLEVGLARGTPLDSQFNAFPPPMPVNLTIYEGHFGDPGEAAYFPVYWTGQISGAAYTATSELLLTGEPNSASMKRPGLRENYQLGCPLALYGSRCGADRPSQERTRVVESISNRTITLTASVTTPAGVNGFLGGTIQWTRADGISEIVTIVGIDGTGLALTVRGLLRGLEAAMEVVVVAGCNRTMAHCLDIHDNIHNFGGQPFIPVEDPFSNTSIFY